MRACAGARPADAGSSMAKDASLPTHGDGARADPEAARALRPALYAAYAAGRDTYGDFGLEYEAFAHGTLDTVRMGLARLGLESTTEQLGQALERAAGADLYLARACEADSSEAWARLHGVFEPLLRAVARRRGAGADEADDLAGSVIAQLATPPPSGAARTILGTYNGAGSLRGWMSVILLRRRAGEARKRSSLRLDEQRDLPTQDGRGPGRLTPTDPADGLEDAETAVRLKAALERGWNTLTRREKLALVLKYAQGLKQRHMATLLGIGEPRVSRLVSQALGKLGSAVLRTDAREDALEEPRRASLRDAIRESLASWAVRTPPMSGRNHAGEPPHGS